MKTFFFLLIPIIVLIRLGFPPFDLAPATIAGWAILLSYIQPERRSSFYALGGAWLAGFIWNLSMTYYVAYPHWATSIGWVVLSMYLALYWVVWAWGCRLASSRSVPIWVVAPALWTGLELLQGHLLSGFLLNQQAIIFYKAPILLQVCEFAGSYAVSFVIILIAALIYQIWDKSVKNQISFGTVLLLALVLTAYAGSGFWLLEQANNKLSANDSSSPKDDFSLVTGLDPDEFNVALIQGNEPCTVEYNPQSVEDTFNNYRNLTFLALHNSPRPNAVVWPEGIFRYPRMAIGEVEPEPDETNFQGTKEDYLNTIQSRIKEFQPQIGIWSKTFDVNFITGVDRLVFSGKDVMRYNSVVGVDSLGHDAGQYDKRHLVLFGEYIPFADQFPILKQISPIGGGMQAGKTAAVPLSFYKDDSPKAASAAKNQGAENDNSSWNFLPSVCYENTLPHVIRTQVLESTKPIDALLNLSNDGWFKGCYENELRFAQGVFRAIETRKNHLFVSNGGRSAIIAPTGHIIQSGEKGTLQPWGRTVKSEVIVAKLKKNGYRDVITTYVQFGDVFALFCLIYSVIILFILLLQPAKSLNLVKEDGKIE